MEDFEKAHLARKNDTEALLDNGGCSTGAFHLGGITVECRLKSLLIQYHKIRKWDDKSQRQKDSMYNQEIKNPGHGLFAALRRMPELYRRAKSDKRFMESLSNIMHPLGPSDVGFIDLRYVAQQSQPNQEATWRKDFNYILNWLTKNEDYIR